MLRPHEEDGRAEEPDPDAVALREPGDGFGLGNGRVIDPERVARRDSL